MYVGADVGVPVVVTVGAPVKCGTMEIVSTAMSLVAPYVDVVQRTCVVPLGICTVAFDHALLALCCWPDRVKRVVHRELTHVCTVRVPVAAPYLQISTNRLEKRGHDRGYEKLRM